MYSSALSRKVSSICSPLFGVLGVVVVELEVVEAMLGVEGGGAAGGSNTLAGTAVTVWYTGVPTFPFLESLLVFSLLDAVVVAGVASVFSPGEGPRGVAPPALDPATPTTPSLAWTVLMRGSLWRRRNNRIFSGKYYLLSVAVALQYSLYGSLACMLRPATILTCSVRKREWMSLYVSRGGTFAKAVTCNK